MPGLATDNYAAHGARLLGATGTDVDPDSDRALQGIGLVLLAIYQHLTTGQAAPPGRRTWWPRPTAARGPQPDVSARDFTGLARIVAQVTGAGTPRRHAETLLAGYQELMAAMPPDADQPAEGPPPVLAGPEVAAVLASLWSASTWRRLEICSPSAAGSAGYCVTAEGRITLTADALRNPDGYPPGIRQLAALLAMTGWQRLEIIGDPAHGRPYGWCEHPDGRGSNLADLLGHALRVPAPAPPRYQAPKVATEPVTAVISPSPPPPPRPRALPEHPAEHPHGRAHRPRKHRAPRPRTRAGGHVTTCRPPHGTAGTPACSSPATGTPGPVPSRNSSAG